MEKTITKSKITNDTQAAITTPNKQSPNSQTIKRRLGNTTFTINIYCSGTETAEDKMLRLIRNALAKSA